MNPPAARLVTPTVAAIRQLATQAVVNAKVSVARSSGLRRPVRRPSRYAPMSASTVSPAAIAAPTASPVAGGAGLLGPKIVQLLTIRAPSAIPGHARQPHSSAAARAIPEGGQIAVTLPGGIAIWRPS